MDSEQPHRCKCKVGSCPLCGSACKRCGCACDGVEPRVALARSTGQRGPKRLSTGSGSEQREAAKKARIEIAKSCELQAFDTLYSLLEDCLTPADIAGRCFAKGTISKNDLEEIQAASPEYKQRDAILRAVRKSVAANVDHFYIFLDLLNMEPKYSNVVNQLRKSVQELKSCAGGIQQNSIIGQAKALPEVSTYAENVKAIYKRTNVIGDQWLPVQFHHYINLRTVEKMEDIPQEEEETYIREAMNFNIKQYAKKNKRIIAEITSRNTRGNGLIKMEQIGFLANGEKASCIIVEGTPGIGKSTFCWHLGVRWAQKEILLDYHLVVLLHLRDKRVQEAKCLSDLFYYKEQEPQEHKTVVRWMKKCGGHGVMLVLDGFDELPSHLQTSSIFADIIKGEVLPKMTVLISSRLSANKNLYQLCHYQSLKCQYIEVIGFGKEEIQKYVDSALEHNKKLGDELKSYLENHPHIHGIMYVPLNCAIIVKVFRDAMKRKRKPPETLTQVYQLLIEILLQRHEMKLVKSPSARGHNDICTNNPPVFSWLSDVSEQTISQLMILAKLAYDGTKEDQLIFYEQNGLLETLGLLQEVPQLDLENSRSSISSYHFLHKTVQEFMAALYVSSLPPEKRTEFVRICFGNSNLRMVMRFIAGLCKFPSQDDKDSIIALQTRGKDELLESLHWLFEAHDPDLVQRCMQGNREWKLALYNRMLSSFDCYVLGYCISKSRQPWDIKLHYCYISGECIKMLMMVDQGIDSGYIKSMALVDNRQLIDQGAIVLGTMLTENKVFTSLTLEFCKLFPEQLCELCKTVGENTVLTSLDLSGNSFDDQSVASLGAMLRKNTVLTSLELRFCELGPEGLCEVCEAVGVNTTLISLDLTENMFDDQSVESLVKMLKENKVLKSLQLYNCELDSEGLSRVCRAVGVNTTLTSLDLTENKFDDQSASILGTMLKTTKILKSLSLGYCELDTKGLCTVCKAIAVNNTLTSLNLSGNKFDDTSVPSLCAMLTKNNVLTSLNIANCTLGPNGLCKVCRAIAMQNTTLTLLDLSMNKFDEQSVASLETMLSENKVLMSLRLVNSGLSPNGLGKVCRTTQVNTMLASLDLSENKFDDQSTTSLGTMLRENKVLTSLGLDGCELSPDGLCKVFKAVGMNTKLTSLHVSRNKFDDQSVAIACTMLRENKVLTLLRLDSCELSSKDLCEVCEAVAVNTKLTSLDLSKNKFDDESVAHLENMLKKNKVLTSLKIFDCNLSPESLCDVCRAIQDNTTLTALDLSGNNFYDQSVSSLEIMLRQNKTLISLGLRECGLFPEGLNEVCRAIGVNSALTSLNITWDKHDDHISYSLGTMLKKNKVLKSLELLNCELGREGLSKLCRAIRGNTALTSLNLSQNKFDDQSTTSLGQVLKENKVLSSLELQHCELDQDHLCKVCNSVEANTTLTSLSLSGNKFNDHSVASLVKMLKGNKVLTSLELQNCELSQECLCKVCSAIGVNNMLTSLNLSKNKFDDQSAVCLGTMLRENSVLTSLKIENCELSPGGLIEVCSATGVNTTLTSLDLAFNNFEASLAQLLTNSKTLEELCLGWYSLDDDAVCSLTKGLMHCKLKKLVLYANDSTERGVMELFKQLDAQSNPTLTLEVTKVPQYDQLHDEWVQ